MGDAAEFVKFRHIRNCHAVDPAYAAGVAKALGGICKKALASQKRRSDVWQSFGGTAGLNKTGG